MEGGCGMGKRRAGRRPVTVRVARWSAEHPWRAIGAWVAFVAVCFIGGNAVGMAEQNNEMNIGEAGRAASIVRAGNFDHPETENVLITAREGGLDATAAIAAATDAASR